MRAPLFRYVLLVSFIKWYKSLIFEISINGRNSLRSRLGFCLSSSPLVEFRRGLRSIVCSPKYTKLAAYLLISVHDPYEILSVSKATAFTRAYRNLVGLCFAFARHLSRSLSLPSPTEGKLSLIKLLSKTMRTRLLPLMPPLSLPGDSGRP